MIPPQPERPPGAQFARYQADDIRPLSRLWNKLEVEQPDFFKECQQPSEERQHQAESRAAHFLNNGCSVLSKSEKTRATATRLGLVNSVHATAAEAAEGADLVILCTPLGVCGALAEVARREDCPRSCFRPPDPGYVARGLRAA